MNSLKPKLAKQINQVLQQFELTNQTVFSSAMLSKNYRLNSLAAQYIILKEKIEQGKIEAQKLNITLEAEE